MTKIAVVDDDPSVRNAIRRLLTASGMDVQAYASGEEAQGALPGWRPDCLIIDIQMPDMTGDEVIAKLREAGIVLPTVVITAIDLGEAMIRIDLPGAICLRKPFDEATLMRAIATAMSGHPDEV